MRFPASRTLIARAATAVLLASPWVHAQAPTPAPKAVDPAVIQALKDMGAHLQSLKRFTVSTDLTGERVLADGQKLQHEAHATVDVIRPNKLHAKMQSSRNARELIYDGKVVTLYTPAQKYYSTVEFSGNLVELTARLQDNYGVEIPLSDLFDWGTAKAPTDNIQSAMNAGQDYVGDDLCDHYAFRQGQLDWQIWVTTGGKPLPRKLVITNRGDEARPQSVSVITWGFKSAVTDASFKFKPPAGAKKIDIVPRKAK